MKANITMHATKALQAAFVAALLSVMSLMALYFVVESQADIAIAQSATSTFSVTQVVGAEISFLTSAANVTMSGPLSGLTGGNATGTTQAVVRTNNATGYNMTIAFSDADADGNMMRREAGGASTGAIKNYSTSTVYNNMIQPTFGFSFASTAAMFAYTATASDTNDIAQGFLNNNTDSCNTGSFATTNVCWMAPSTTAYEVTNRTSSAAAGSTTTVRFRVYIPSSPSPGVDTGAYTATATLTAINNP